MQRYYHTDCWRLTLALVAVLWILPHAALAAGTIIDNVREGRHAGFTRIVFDSRGARPQPMGPIGSTGVSIRYADLALNCDLATISSRLGGAVDRIEWQAEADRNVILLKFKAPDARVKSIQISSNEKKFQAYRLVLDVYPQPAAQQTQTAPPPIHDKVVPPAVRPEPNGAPRLAQVAAGDPAETLQPQVAKAAVTSPPEQTIAASDSAVDAMDAPSDAEAAEWTVSGEASLILRSPGGDEDAAKFQEYRDVTAPVAGDLRLSMERDRDYYLHGEAEGIGQDDPYAAAGAGRYGKFGIDASWDKIIHRYATDARTLYSGVGSGSMLLDDNLQANVQAAPDAAETANRLSGFMASADTGDPMTTRDKRKLKFNLTMLDPVTLTLKLSNEKREGTRPFAGAFSSSEMVELFQPVDYDTNEVRISGQYAKAPFYVNVAYQFSQFENNVDTLTFDNPLRATDTLGGPSSGAIDLAPDNQAHHFSVSGAWSQLPWRSQITANAAWGRMSQDDALVPYTTNPAIAAPALPTDRADAKVDTTLYTFRVTSRPLSIMRVKGNVSYYDYDNRTGIIEFPDGYVETDASLVTTPIRNLPTSYTKTRADAEAGVDVFSRSQLTLGYEYVKTDRENREVAEQKDHIMKAALDTRALRWLDLRSSYARTLRDIGDYRFDVYTDSGDDLQQLPQLRKYNQADLTRDRFELTATVFPTDALALSGQAAYTMDDFSDSPYGLLEDNQTLLAFDADYAVGERLTLNLFYTHEIYENEQRDRQNGGASDFDWTASGTDLVDTVGGTIRLALIPDHLDADLTYAFSDVDGELDFSSPSGSFAPYTAVDDTRLHMLNTRLIYHHRWGVDVALGYLWEKFDYDDFAIEGYTDVPTDSAGSYQGALLAGTLPQDYDAHVVYTRITFHYP